MLNKLLTFIAVAFSVLCAHELFSSTPSKNISSLLPRLTYSCHQEANSKVLKAYIDREVVGLATYKEKISEHDEILDSINHSNAEFKIRKAKIETLDVVSNWQRHGIAGQMLDITLANIRSINKKPVEIYLRAYPFTMRQGDIKIPLPDLAAFYQNHGAHIVAQYPLNGSASQYVMKFPAMNIRGEV